MTQRKPKRQKRSRSLKNPIDLEILGKHSAGILHDIANPLTVVLLALEQIKHFEKIPEIREPISLARLSAIQMKSILETASVYKKKSPSKKFCPKKELKNIILLFAYYAQEKDVHVSFSASTTEKIRGCSCSFFKAFANLIENAIDACEGISSEKTVTIMLSVRNDKMLITISDSGCGIPKGVQKDIFEPFYTTKPRGSGLGLAITKENIEKNFNGTVTYTSTEGVGTIFKILIPILPSK